MVCDQDRSEKIKTAHCISARLLVQASSKYNLLWDKIVKRKMKITPQSTDRPKAFHRVETACEALGRERGKNT
jgi:hypothetical protein